MLAAAAVGLAFACGGSSQAAYEPFPEYENVEEVPVVGSLDSDKPRVGPPPPRSAVRLAAHYLRISRASSKVRCHGIPGGLIACRVHIADFQATIAARLTLTPEGNSRDRILRCETTRLIEGRLSEAPCFDFTVWIFNKWQAGPPQIPSARRPATARAGRPPAPEVWTTGAENLEIGDADLKGAVNPHGIPTTVHFQYGPTTSYGFATNRSNTFEGNRRRMISAIVFELRPGMTYHYRLVADSEGRKTYGADMTFTSMKWRPKRRAMIACFHEETGRFTGQAQPSRCTLKGHRGSEVVKVPITGMKWGHWGSKVTRAAYGVDTLNGGRVRIIAFRRVTCDDGRTWYSMAIVGRLRNGTFFGLGLPACNGLRTR